jgi:hypothetical protein
MSGFVAEEEERENGHSRTTRSLQPHVYRKMMGEHMIQVVYLSGVLLCVLCYGNDHVLWDKCGRQSLKKKDVQTLESVTLSTRDLYPLITKKSERMLIDRSEFIQILLDLNEKGNVGIKASKDEGSSPGSI